MPPKIDNHKCNGCGICLFQCGSQCFIVDPQKYIARPKFAFRCVDCQICQHKCPPQAITVKIKKPIRGLVKSIEVKNLAFTGLLVADAALDRVKSCGQHIRED